MFRHSHCFRQTRRFEDKTRQLLPPNHATDHVDMVEVNSQLKQLVKTGDLRDARRMFDKMPHRNEITWTVMISGYVTDMDTSGALVLFSLMCYGESLDGYLVKTGFLNSVFVRSAPLDMYSKFGKIEQGCMVFGEMPPRNVVSWTAIITDLGAWNWGREIPTHGLMGGFDVITFVANSLASMSNNCGQLDHGLCLFERMSTPNVVSWIAIISTNVRLRQEENAMRAFLRMRESSVCPNEFTFAAVISGRAGIMRIDSGRQLHAHVLSIGLEKIKMIHSGVINGYSKCVSIKEASKIFDEAEYNDIMSWTAMINGFAGHGFSYEAIDLFEKLPMVAWNLTL
ncbi:hypothetical protein SLEP1_g12080 [Rubroshorea leprosula]|nr:hypothetical protein SLEP1_g12080 [Rubroshorea leprosula]